jgi:asparagine synthase (glutamine-hydrolysing)
MSGICGLFRFDGGEVSSRDLERMTRALATRGPDGSKFVADGPVGLSHCLMRVNREDLFEVQPLYDREAAVTLVADLRLDNREELAAAFGIGTPELSEVPDSALVLRAYKTWGENCAEHLLGDFAFAIWDGDAKKLCSAATIWGSAMCTITWQQISLPLPPISRRCGPIPTCRAFYPMRKSAGY